MITEPHSMEMLNRAYVYALASRARVNLGPVQLEQDVYDYGLDGRFAVLTMLNGKPQPTGCELHYQLKATRNWKDKGDSIEYLITKKAFNKMAAQNGFAYSQIILLLYCLPEDASCWAVFDEAQLILRKCCYWFYVGNNVLETGDGFHRLLIPKANLVTPDALDALLAKVQKREALA